MLFNSLDELKKYYNVKSHKETDSGLVAIRKGGYWLYFRYEQVGNKWGYRQSGSTERFVKSDGSM